MNLRFTAAIITAAAATFFCAGGCGYKIGNLGHPQLKSIAIAPVTNETASYNISAQARSILCEAFMTDGTMKLTHLSTADCILYTKIKQVSFSEVSWSNDDEDEFVPNQWRASLSLEYSLIVPGQAKPAASGSVNGSAEFMTGPDMEIGRLNGVRQALFAASKNIIYKLTEGW